MSAASPLLYVATPCYGGLAHVSYMRSLLALGPACKARGVGLRLYLGGGEALIARARAGMLEAFRRSDATHLLFVDADIGFAPEDAFRLLKSGYDVVGGAYPKRADTADPEHLLLDEAPTADGFRRATAAGTGFLLISRPAADRMVAAYPRLRARLGDVNAAVVPEAVMLFESMMEPESGRYLSDYEAFCRRWRDLGGEVWVDTNSGLTHLAEREVRLPSR